MALQVRNTGAGTKIAKSNHAKHSVYYRFFRFMRSDYQSCQPWKGVREDAGYDAGAMPGIHPDGPISCKF
jgi:hypothetical protein